MKQLLTVIISAVLLGATAISGAAFIPTYQLENKIDTATETLMDLVVEKGAGYGKNMLHILDNLEKRFIDEGNERNEYIAGRLLAELHPFMSCVTNGGTRVLGVDECEYIDRLTCLEMDGIFNECASACRHEEDDVVCTRECVPVCEVPIDRPVFDQDTTNDELETTTGSEYEEVYDDILYVNSTLRSCTNQQGYVDKCYQIRPQGQAGRELSLTGVNGLNWQKGFIYTLRVSEYNGTYSLIEIVDKEVDLDICREYFDGCNTCTVKDGVVTNCTDKNCSDQLTLSPKCTQFVE